MQCLFHWLNRNKSGSDRDGEGMAREDLKHPRSTDEAKEWGRKGGRASGEARRKKRAMRERLQALLDGVQNGQSGADALAAALFGKALSGDVKAFETIMAVVGEAPRQMVGLSPLPKLQSAADLPKLTASIIRAVAGGGMTPDEGTKLASLAGAHMKAIEAGELEQRIAALEAATAKEVEL